MSMDQANVVDMMSIDKESGVVHLTVADDLEWSQEHLMKLQEKLNFHLAFIESGEIFVRYPDAGNWDIKINVLMKFRPTEDALLFLQQAARIIEEAGILFDYGPVPGGYVGERG
jgi:hypothetical protein